MPANAPASVVESVNDPPSTTSRQTFGYVPVPENTRFPRFTVTPPDKVVNVSASERNVCVNVPASPLSSTTSEIFPPNPTHTQHEADATPPVSVSVAAAVVVMAFFSDLVTAELT